MYKKIKVQLNSMDTETSCDYATSFFDLSCINIHDKCMAIDYRYAMELIMIMRGIVLKSIKIITIE